MSHFRRSNSRSRSRTLIKPRSHRNFNKKPWNRNSQYHPSSAERRLGGRDELDYDPEVLDPASRSMRMSDFDSVYSNIDKQFENMQISLSRSKSRRKSNSLGGRRSVSMVPASKSSYLSPISSGPEISTGDVRASRFAFLDTPMSIAPQSMRKQSTNSLAADPMPLPLAQQQAPPPSVPKPLRTNKSVPKNNEQILKDLLEFNGSSRYIPTPKKLGEGSFGFVYMCVDLGEKKSESEEAKSVAIKVGLCDESLINEILALKKLRHPNILPVYDVLFGPVYAFGERYAAIVMPMAISNLRDAAPQIRLFHDKLKLLRDCACGLQYLHASGFVHLDLKTQNVLIMEDGRACIADFGLARVMIAPKENPNMIFTVHYRAPELLCDKKDYDAKKADLWAFGALFYAIFFGGDSPFIQDLNNQMDDGNFNYVFSRVNKTSGRQMFERRAMLSIYLAIMYGQRKDPEVVKHYPWITQLDQTMFEYIDEKLNAWSAKLFKETGIEVAMEDSGASDDFCRLRTFHYVEQDEYPEGLGKAMLNRAPAVHWNMLGKHLLRFLNVIPENRAPLSEILESPLLSSYDLCAEKDMSFNYSSSLCRVCTRVQSYPIPEDLSPWVSRISADDLWPSESIAKFIRNLRLEKVDSDTQDLVPDLITVQLYNAKKILALSPSSSAQLRRWVSPAKSALLSAFPEVRSLQDGLIEDMLLLSSILHMALIVVRSSQVIYLFENNRYETVVNQTDTPAFWCLRLLLEMGILPRDKSQKMMREGISNALSDAFNAAFVVVGDSVDWDLNKLIQSP